jgi:cytoskeletal protein CcmA (bactofilin family)
MSVFCAHCRKRLILEDYNIKSYQAVAGYATCGDVIVHKQGRVAAPIQAGKVRVRGRVEIAATGTLTGSVSAPSITVSDGARLEAYCEIRPEPPASEVKPAGVITEGEAPKPPGTAKAVRVTSTKAKSKEPDASPAKAAAQVKSISTRRRAGTKVSS